MPEFPYDWALLEVVRRLPRWVPLGWTFWATLAANAAVVASNVHYRLAAQRSQSESRESRRETVLLRRAVWELLGKPQPMNILQVPALYAWPLRNYDKGRPGRDWDLIILHGMAGTLTGTGAWFKNPLARASSHYGVGSPNAAPDRDEVHQFVQLDDVAWGVREDSRLARANSRAVQIEIQNRDRQGRVWVKEAWYVLTAELVYDLARQKGRRPDRSWVIPHREADPRKVLCPADIDVERIVREAQARWDGNTVHVPVVQADFEPQKPTGGEIPAVKASVSAGSGEVVLVTYDTPRIATVTAENGVNVRVAADPNAPLYEFVRNGRTVHAFPKGASFYVTGVVIGTAVVGYDRWLITQGGRRVWAAATDHK